MSNNLIDDIIYKSGLVAQGCWDELDDYAREAIIRSLEIAAETCANICMSQADRRNIRTAFGLKVESNVKYTSPEAKNSVQSQYVTNINIPKGS